MSLPFSFAYDSSGVLLVGTTGTVGWHVSPSGYLRIGGWSYPIPMLSYRRDHKIVGPSTNQQTCNFKTDFLLYDSEGTRHNLHQANIWETDATLCPQQSQLSISIDGRFSMLHFLSPIKVAALDGTVYSVPSCVSDAVLVVTEDCIVSQVEDTNGNIITISNSAPAAPHGGVFTVTDELGRASISISGIGSSGDTVQIAGQSNPFRLSWAPQNINFATAAILYLSSPGGCLTPATWGPDMSSISGVTAITTPNGKQYIFAYDQNYGTVSQITYPSGGWVKYQWGLRTQSQRALTQDGSHIPNACRYVVDVPAILHRSVSFDGVTVALDQDFSYSRLNPDGTDAGPKTTTVTTFDRITGASSKQVYTYPPDPVLQPIAYPHDTSVTYQDGSGTTLKTVTKTWLNEYVQSQTLVTLENGTSSRTTYTYVPTTGFPQASQYSQILQEQDEYDFGQSAPSRKTVYTYQSFGNSPIFQGPLMFNRACSIVVSDGAAPVAETDYFYDGSTSTTPCSSTTAQALPGNGNYSNHDETNFGTTFTAARGNVTRAVHKCLQSCTDSTTTLTYDETGQVTSRTDACGNATCSDMNGASHTTTYSYGDNFDSNPSSNTNAYLTQITDSLGHISKFKYTYSDGQLIQSQNQNDISASRSGTTYLYNDSLRRLTETDYPDGGKTTLSYNDAAPTPSVTTTRLVTATPSLANISTTAVLDGMGHVTQTQLTTDPDCPAGDKTDKTYDGFGRIRIVSNPYCSTSDSTYGLTTYAYDALGRVTQVTNPDTSTKLTTYVGAAIQSQDEGNGTQRVSRISQSDALGRLISICEVAPGPFVGAGGSSSSSLIGSGGTPAACGQSIAGTGFLTTYRYDVLNNLIQVNQSGIGARTFAYDSLSRLTSSSNPESGVISYTYDANGNVQTKTAPAPNQTSTATVTTTYQYDQLNRLTQKSYSDGTTPTVTFIYDSISGATITNGIGRLVRASTPCSSDTTQYDPVGRISNEVQYPYTCVTPNAPNSFAYSYDLAGNMTSGSNGYFHTYTYTYNTAGRLTALTSDISDSTDPPNLLSAVHYNALGLATSDTLGNGETESFSYSNRGRAQSSTVSQNSSTHYSFNISSFAPNGNILAASDSADGTWSYSYDPFNRLVGSNKNSGQAVFNYVYDRFGNRWQQNGPNSFIATFTGNNPGNPANNNRMDGFSYDTAGNLLNDGVHSYTYDAENRITKVDGGTTATYVYDANSRRVHRTGVNTFGCDTASTFSYAFDLSDHPILAVNSNFAACVYEIFAGDRHLAHQGGGTTFSHADWLGTERVRSTYNGVVCESISSLPFGDAQTTSGGCYHPSSLHFTGKERDSESGLDNFGARYDSSTLGRFISPDPLGGHLENPQSLNKYAYALNNPINLTDPTGLDSYLTCQNVSSTCREQIVGYDKDGNAQKTLVQGATDKDGNFTATLIGNDKDGNLVDKTTGTGTYTASVNGSGVQFSNDGGKTSSIGVFVNGTPETTFQDTGFANGNALTRFTFTLTNSKLEANQTAAGYFGFAGSPDQAAAALQKAGFVPTFGENTGIREFRTPGTTLTGTNSAHFNLIPRVLIDPGSTLPAAGGTVHFGEHFPYNPIGLLLHCVSDQAGPCAP